MDQLGFDGETIQRVFDGEVQTEPAAPSAVDFSAAPSRVGRVRVRFVTPTELKAGERLAERPEFPILFGRLRDRIGKEHPLRADVGCRNTLYNATPQSA